MSSHSSSNFLLYVALLGGLLFIFFSLDQFFGLHYEPEEHRLNKKHATEAHAASDSTHAEDSHSKTTAELTEKTTPKEEKVKEEKEEDPYFSEEMKKYWLGAIFFISIFFAVRTFRNKDSA